MLMEYYVYCHNLRDIANVEEQIYYYLITEMIWIYDVCFYEDVLPIW